MSATAGYAATSTALLSVVALSPRLSVVAASLATTALVNARSATQHLFSAGSEHSLERFNAVIRRLEEEILDDGLSPLQLRNQHLRVGAARHFAADLWHHTVPTRTVQHYEDAPFPRLHEIRGLGNLVLPDSRWSPAFPSCHSFG
jgi:hypothetical protein